MARVRRCHEIEPGDTILGDQGEDVVVTRAIPMGGARTLCWTDEHGSEKSRMFSHFMGVPVPGEADEADVIQDILDGRHPQENSPLANRDFGMGSLAPPIPRAV